MDEITKGETCRRCQERSVTDLGERLAVKREQMISEIDWAESEVRRLPWNSATKAKIEDNFKIYSWVLNTLWSGKQDWDKPTTFVLCDTVGDFQKCSFKIIIGGQNQIIINESGK